MKILFYKLMVISTIIFFNITAKSQENHDSTSTNKVEYVRSRDNKIRITVYMLCFVEDGKIVKVEYQKVEGDSCSKEELEQCKSEATKAVQRLKSMNSVNKKSARILIPIIFDLPKEDD